MSDIDFQRLIDSVLAAALSFTASPELLAMADRDRVALALLAAGIAPASSSEDDQGFSA